MKVTVPGRTIPRNHIKILTSEDRRPTYFSELEGPEEAFDLIEGARRDMVKVVKPDLVKIETFRSLS